MQALNAYADPPNLNVIVTAPSGVLRQRLARRGSHGRFEDHPANTVREVVLYQEVVPTLESAGITTLVVDTAAGPQETVSRLTSTIQALWSHRHRDPA